jgi:hypothetical protein
MFLNAVDYMITLPAPPVTNILANGGFEDGVALRGDIAALFENSEHT